VAQAFTQRTSAKKAKNAGFDKNLQSIRDYHHALWPGVPVGLLAPKQAKLPQMQGGQPQRSLEQVLAFCLDPKRKRGFVLEATPIVYNLLTRSNAKNIGSQRGRTAIMTEDLANKVWNGQERFLSKAIAKLPAASDRSMKNSAVNLPVFMDGSNVGKRPLEIFWLWSPEKQQGGWAPPLDMQGEPPFAKASRCVQIAWEKLTTWLPMSTLQETMLTSVRRVSSCCTGAYTGEMSLAVEMDETCRQLICDHMRWCNDTLETYEAPHCVHGDVTAIVPTGSVPSGLSFQEMIRAVDKAPFKVKQFCYTHNRRCILFGPRAVTADYDISGLPCPDMSRIGLKKYEEGATAPVFACHAKMHVEHGTKMLIIENVPELRMNMIETLYGRHYDIVQLFVSPADQGHAGVARNRTYLILTRKHVVRQVRDVTKVYTELSHHISSLVQTRPRDYLVASRLDLLMEVREDEPVSLHYLLNDRELRGLSYVCRLYKVHDHCDCRVSASVIGSSCSFALPSRRCEPSQLSDMGKSRGHKRKEPSKSSSEDEVAASHSMLEDSDSGESDMFPGGLAAHERFTPKTGGTKRPPKAKAVAKNKSSDGGRRSAKEDYTHQRIYKDFIDHHILVWLQDVDETWMHRDTFGSCRRGKLFAVLAFAFGWLATDTKAGENKAAIVTAANSQYKRRNFPVAHTGWGPDEIFSYMRWQLSQYHAGKIKRDAVGGWAWKLPKKNETTGEPAPLPDEVVAFTSRSSNKRDAPSKDKKKKKTAKDESSDHGSSSSSSDDDDSDAGPVVKDYKLREQPGGRGFKLVETLGGIVGQISQIATGTSVVLPDGEYQLKHSSKGTMLFDQKDMKKGVSCASYIAEKRDKKKQRDDDKSRDRSRSRKLAKKDKTRGRSRSKKTKKDKHHGKNEDANRDEDKKKAEEKKEVGEKGGTDKSGLIPPNATGLGVASSPLRLKGMPGTGSKTGNGDSQQEQGTPESKDSDVDSLFESEDAPAKVVVPEPFLFSVVDGTWLAWEQANKMLLLPAETWDLKKDPATAVWMLHCLTKLHSPRLVEKLLSSKRAVEFDAAIVRPKTLPPDAEKQQEIMEKKQQEITEKKQEIEKEATGTEHQKKTEKEGDNDGNRASTAAGNDGKDESAAVSSPKPLENASEEPNVSKELPVDLKQTDMPGTASGKKDKPKAKDDKTQATAATPAPTPSPKATAATPAPTPSPKATPTIDKLLAANAGAKKK
ncbi:unnamed protein product, partial [Symbiodinium microadriaticum]